VEGSVTLPNSARNKSPGPLGSRRSDDFVPVCMADALKARCEMALDVEGVLGCCMH
jgi:hypothetical protein